MKEIIGSVFLVLNLFTLLLMAWDKRQAANAGRRVPERRFFTLALCGGSLGVLAGMSVWKHKRQKRSFKYQVYGIILLQIIVLAWFGRGWFF